LFSAYFKVLTTKHGLMASAGTRAYNGGLGAEPPAGSRGRAPGQGAKPPWSWKPFSFSASNDSGKIYPIDCMWHSFLFLGASKFQVEFYLIAVTKSRFVFCPRRPSGREKNWWTFVHHRLRPKWNSAISNPCLLLYSSTGYQIFKHRFPISKHVRAC